MTIAEIVRSDKTSNQKNVLLFKEGLKDSIIQWPYFAKHQKMPNEDYAEFQNMPNAYQAGWFLGLPINSAELAAFIPIAISGAIIQESYDCIKKAYQKKK